ncbi:MAG: hypothetical protein ACSHXI_02405 [Hoeflea sp.]|uniref:hypothetical protein n=1 Tax=Hoeflea sp. TaxID=1940281 RepID=UPI003EFAF781
MADVLRVACDATFVLPLPCCSANAYIQEKGLASGSLRDTTNDHEHTFNIS